MEKRKVLILVALQFEARALSRALDRLGPADAACRFATQVIGPRAAHLPRVESDVSAVFLAGLSGALDPSLKTGDVFIDEASTFQIDAQLPRRRIHTAETIVAKPEQKRDLRNRTAADAVDMESDIVGAWAAGRNLPYLGIRAVADRADDTLDPIVAKLVDERGNTRRGGAAAALLKRPALLPRLLHARRISNLALNRLADELKTILGALA